MSQKRPTTPSSTNSPSPTRSPLKTSYQTNLNRSNGSPSSSKPRKSTSSRPSLVLPLDVEPPLTPENSSPDTSPTQQSFNTLPSQVPTQHPSSSPSSARTSPSSSPAPVASSTEGFRMKNATVPWLTPPKWDSVRKEMDGSPRRRGGSSKGKERERKRGRKSGEGVVVDRNEKGLVDALASPSSPPALAPSSTSNQGSSAPPPTQDAIKSLQVPRGTVVTKTHPQRRLAVSPLVRSSSSLSPKKDAPSSTTDSNDTDAVDDKANGSNELEGNSLEGGADGAKEGGQAQDGNGTDGHCLPLEGRPSKGIDGIQEDKIALQRLIATLEVKLADRKREVANLGQTITNGHARSQEQEEKLRSLQEEVELLTSLVPHTVGSSKFSQRSISTISQG